jgi:CDP-diacylglycerol--glycerol-3-phosphate 3-phosphatidyltransferase
MANIITGFRVLISIALLFCPVFSPVFYILYLTVGLSDMIDGTIARKMNTVTEFGARFDTAFDISHSPTKVFGDSGMCGCDFCGSSGRALYQDRSGHKMTGY